MPKPTEPVFLSSSEKNCNTKLSSSHHQQQQDQHQTILELQLLPSSDNLLLKNSEDNCATHLKLSIGSCEAEEKIAKQQVTDRGNSSTTACTPEPAYDVSRLKEFANEELKLAIADKAYAEEARREAKRQIEMSELEFANAKRIRQQAQAELEKAQLLKEQASKKISSTILQITCQACKQQFQTSTTTALALVVGGVSDETSLAMSYMSSATTEGEDI